MNPQLIPAADQIVTSGLQLHGSPITPDYNRPVAVIVGSVLVLLGLALISLETIQFLLGLYKLPLPFVIFAGICACCTGKITISAGKKKRTKLISAAKILSIVNIIASGPAIILSGLCALTELSLGLDKSHLRTQYIAIQCSMAFLGFVSLICAVIVLMNNKRSTSYQLVALQPMMTTAVNDRAVVGTGSQMSQATIVQTTVPPPIIQLQPPTPAIQFGGDNGSPSCPPLPPSYEESCNKLTVESP